LHISGPTLFGPRYIAPLLAAFLSRYPELTASLGLSEEYDDPATTGADVTAIRQSALRLLPFAAVRLVSYERQMDFALRE
jgi:DNA-binding transcriptional LysR family regulator